MGRVLNVVVCSLWLGACLSSHSPPDGATDASDAASDSGDATVDSGDATVDSGDAGPRTRCGHSTECQLVPATCCGSCGAHTREDVVSLHRDDVSAHQTRVCGDDATCPACFQRPDPALLAECVDGECTVLDLYDPAQGF